MGDVNLGLGPGIGAGGDLKDPLAGLLGQDDGSGMPPGMDDLFKGLANMYGGASTNTGG